MNDILKQYLSKKYNLGQNQNPNYAESEQEAGMRIGSGLDKALEREQMDDETRALLTAQEARMTPMPEPTLPEADDLAEPANTAAAQAPNAGMDAGLGKDDPLNPSLSNELDKKYALSPDVSYDKLKETQRSSSILNALGDLDTAVGQLGSSPSVYAKKAGYDVGEYKGGELNKLAAQKQKEFEDRLKYQTDEQARKAKNIGTESAELDLTKQKRNFDSMLQDEKELNNPNGFLATLLNQQAKQMFGEDNIPAGTTPRQLLKVMPSLAEITKNRIDKDLNLQNELTKMDAAFTQQKDLRELDFENAKRLKEMELAQKASEPQKAGKGQEETDKEFAKKYATWIAEKGSLSADKSLSNVEYAIKEMEANKDLTGGLRGLAYSVAPESVKTALNKKIGTIETSLRSAVVDTLRPLLGGQFAAAEGERLMKQTFDPNQEMSENIRRAKLLLNDLTNQVKSRKRAVTHWENNGNTLAGYKAFDEAQPSKEVVKKQYSKKANKTKFIYSDGTEEILDGQQ